MISTHKKIFITIASVIVGIIGISLIVLLNTTNIDAEVIEENEKVTQVTNCETTDFYVDVKGAVKNPGVYKVNDGMIVSDAIKLAGGITSSGTTNNINLSKKLVAEMVIYVFKKSELTTTKNEIPFTTEVVQNSTCINNDNQVSSNQISNPNTSSGLVNINSATKEQLMSVSGIGESKADAIIEYRSKNRFNCIDDIKNVSGIGDSLFAKIKDYITV